MPCVMPIHRLLHVFEQNRCRWRCEGTTRGSGPPHCSHGFIMEQLTLYGPPRLERPHPAKWSKPLLIALQSIVPPGLVVDPFGGVGSLALLGPRWRVLCGYLEPEWIGQAWKYGATGLRWDATRLPLASGSVPAVITSPAYGNRLADAHQ